MKRAVAQDIRSILNAPNLQEAERLVEIVVEKYKKMTPGLSRWVEENIPEG